jgi:hypothetical protein
MTCELCCSCNAYHWELYGRLVQLCPACLWAHIDFPKLAASLEAAKGRKCLDFGCPAHWPREYAGKWTDNDLCDEQHQSGPPPCRLKKGHEGLHFNGFISWPFPGLHLEVPAMCRCGHSDQYHNGRCTECACYGVMLAVALCICGHAGDDHGINSHRCWADSCECEKFEESSGLTPTQVLRILSSLHAGGMPSFEELRGTNGGSHEDNPPSPVL